MSEPEALPTPRSIGDRFGVAAAAAAIIALALFPIPAATFRRMFADFGNVELPIVTRLAISTWCPLALALAWSVMLALGMRTRMPLTRRRIFVIVAFAGAALSVAVCVIGLYLPIFSLAGNIKAN